MNLDIRNNVYSNFKGNSKKDIIESIDIAINSKDELVLPGLGVLMEIVWNDSDDNLKDKIIEIIYKKMN